MRKKAMILNTSHNDLGLIKSLKKMDFYIISTGNTKGLPGESLVDEYICVDYSDKEYILKLAREREIDAICACCNDFGVITAAYVAEKMGLKGHDTYQNTLKIHHKNQFKLYTKEHDIISPISMEFQSEEVAMAYLKEEGQFPYIVKPVDLSAGNGVCKIANVNEIENAVRNAFLISRVKRIVIEPFIEGKQQGCCTFLKNGKVTACCSNNEYSITNPYRVEIDTFPAENFDKVKGILLEQIEKIAEDLQLEDGIFHVQYIVKDGKPYIIEAMRRVLGNMYSIPAEKVSGFDWDYWEARQHCGLDCSGIPTAMEEKGYFSYRAIMAPKNGTIQSVVIDEKLRPYVFEEFMLWKKGQEIKDYRKEPLGFIFCEFSSQDEMKKMMLDNFDKVYIEMDNDAGVKT